MGVWSLEEKNSYILKMAPFQSRKLTAWGCTSYDGGCRLECLEEEQRIP